MELIIYIAAVLVSFLGLYIGIALSNIAQEELPTASKYLKIFKIIIIALAVFFAIFKFNLVVAIIVALAVLIALYSLKHSDIWIYGSMGALFYLSTVYEYSFIVSVLILCYGTILGTIESHTFIGNKKFTVDRNIRISKMLFEKYYLYIVVGLIFYAVFQYIL